MRRFTAAGFTLVLVLVQVAAAQLPVVRRHEGSLLGAPVSFGRAVVTIGDLDFDGFDDYVANSPEESLPGNPIQCGVVRVYSGRLGLVLHTVTGPFASDRLGWSIGAGGDINGDGVPDFIAGNPYAASAASTGTVRAYSGLTGTLIWSANPGVIYGYRVANAGDVNGDGYADVVASSGSFALPVNPFPQPVVILSGINGSVLHSISGASAGALGLTDFGCSLAGGLDMSGDNVPDVLIGCSSFGGIGGQTGAVIAYSGLNANVVRIFGGAPTYSFMGTSVSWCGDVDLDGVPDLVTGGHGNGSVGVPGIVRVYSGYAGAILHTKNSTVTSDGFGASVAGGLDLDGDAVPDFATSTPAVNASGPPVPTAFATGVVTGYSGATGAPIGFVTGNAPGNKIGSSLAMIRDTNGDGFAEIIVGSPSDDGVYADVGSVQLIELTGFQTYASGNGALQLGMVGGPPGALGAGTVLASGAPPFASGALAADLVGANTTFGNPPFPLYLAQSPALTIVPIVFDANGGFGAALNLKQPAIAGTRVFGQAFDLSAPAIISSPVLVLLFSN